MRVRSKLADVEFRFGAVDRRGYELIIHSHPDQPMKSRVHVTPQDVLAAVRALLLSKAFWVYLLGFPYFYFRARSERPPGKP
ncbi:MAG: hypothetical protein KJZ83_06795 [Burkholderiaceae bacterium]|nr:hypothetical protein [Burkholderiaceae bacterium]